MYRISGKYSGKMFYMFSEGEYRIAAYYGEEDSASVCSFAIFGNYSGDKVFTVNGRLDPQFGAYNWKVKAEGKSYGTKKLIHTFKPQEVTL